MKKKNTTIELLSEMDKHGINELYNVSPFMAEHFPMPEPTIGDSIPWDDKQESTAKHMLNEMHKHGFIKFGMLEETIFKERFDDERKYITNKWFSNTDFYISFTLGGLSYYTKYKQDLEHSKQSKANFFIAFGSLIVAAVSALTAIMTYTRDANNTRDIIVLQNNLEKLEKIHKLQTGTEVPLSKEQKRY